MIVPMRPVSADVVHPQDLPANRESKVGLLDAPAAAELYLADISVPPLVYQRMGIPVPELFRQSSLLRIDPRSPSDLLGQKA